MLLPNHSEFALEENHHRNGDPHSNSHYSHRLKRHGDGAAWSEDRAVLFALDEIQRKRIMVQELA